MSTTLTHVKVRTKLYPSVLSWLCREAPTADLGERYVCGYGDTLVSALLSYGNALVADGYKVDVYTYDGKSALVAWNAHDCIVSEIV